MGARTPAPSEDHEPGITRSHRAGVWGWRGKNSPLRGRGTAHRCRRLELPALLPRPRDTHRQSCRKEPSGAVRLPSDEGTDRAPRWNEGEGRSTGVSRLPAPPAPPRALLGLCQFASCRSQGLPWWLSDKETTCNAGDKGVGQIPGEKKKRKWQPTPVFLPGESHGQRNLEGYTPWGH